jgi:hypothetical protein
MSRHTDSVAKMLLYSIGKIQYKDASRLSSRHSILSENPLSISRIGRFADSSARSLQRLIAYRLGVAS